MNLHTNTEILQKILHIHSEQADDHDLTAFQKRTMDAFEAVESALSAWYPQTSFDLVDVDAHFPFRSAPAFHLMPVGSNMIFRADANIQEDGSFHVSENYYTFYVQDEVDSIVHRASAGTALEGQYFEARLGSTCDERVNRNLSLLDNLKLAPQRIYVTFYISAEIHGNDGNLVARNLPEGLTGTLSVISLLLLDLHIPLAGQLTPQNICGRFSCPIGKEEG